MPLQFETFDAESGAFTYPDDCYDGLLAEFDGLLDAHESGELNDTRCLAALNRLLIEAPDFIDVHAHIASHWHRQGKPKKALDAALVGLRVSNRHIPEGFNGSIEWRHRDNRPYLRAMHIALLSYMRLRRHKDAVTIIELMLARNPADNQGVRFLLGFEALRAGDFEHARAVFEAEATGYPPYFYELALCHMLRRVAGHAPCRFGRRRHKGLGGPAVEERGQVVTGWQVTHRACDVRSEAIIK